MVTKKFSDLQFEIKPNSKAKVKVLHHDRLKPYLSDVIPAERQRLQERVKAIAQESESEPVQPNSWPAARRSTLQSRPPERLIA